MFNFSSMLIAIVEHFLIYVLGWVKLYCFYYNMSYALHN
jgi:hypothetical protein